MYDFISGSYAVPVKGADKQWMEGNAKKVIILFVCHTDTKNVWIVDKTAYDETVIIGYKCSCGAEQ